MDEDRDPKLCPQGNLARSPRRTLSSRIGAARNEQCALASGCKFLQRTWTAHAKKKRKASSARCPGISQALKTHCPRNAMSEKEWKARCDKEKNIQHRPGKNSFRVQVTVMKADWSTQRKGDSFSPCSEETFRRACAQRDQLQAEDQANRAARRKRKAPDAMEERIRRAILTAMNQSMQQLDRRVARLEAKSGLMPLDMQGASQTVEGAAPAQQRGTQDNSAICSSPRRPLSGVSDPTKSASPRASRGDDTGFGCGNRSPGGDALFGWDDTGDMGLMSDDLLGDHGTGQR